MKPLLLLSFLLAGATLHAQDAWLVSLNKKIMVKSSVQDEQVNKKLLRAADWKSSTGYLEVRFKDERPTWIHIMEFVDEGGNQQWKVDSTWARCKISTLRKLYAGKKELKIYMIINPPNNMMAGPSRRVHLATLKLP